MCREEGCKEVLTKSRRAAQQKWCREVQLSHLLQPESTVQYICNPYEVAAVRPASVTLDAVRYEDQSRYLSTKTLVYSWPNDLESF